MGRITEKHITTLEEDEKIEENAEDNKNVEELLIEEFEEIIKKLKNGKGNRNIQNMQ